MTNPLNILIVDSDDHDREGLRRGLIQAGFGGGICIANDGVAALHLLNRRAGPMLFEMKAENQLILLEVDLPVSRSVMSACDFIEALRSDRLWQRLPVYIVSRSRDDALIRQAYGAGASGFITKAAIANDFSLLSDLVGVFANLESLSADPVLA